MKIDGPKRKSFFSTIGEVVPCQILSGGGFVGRDACQWIRTEGEGTFRQIVFGFCLGNQGTGSGELAFLVGSEKVLGAFGIGKNTEKGDVPVFPGQGGTAPHRKDGTFPGAGQALGGGDGDTDASEGAGADADQN